MKNFVDKQKVKILKKYAEETLDEKILNCFFVHNTGSLKLSEKSDDTK